MRWVIAWLVLSVVFGWAWSRWRDHQDALDRFPES